MLELAQRREVKTFSERVVNICNSLSRDTNFYSAPQCSDRF